MTLFTGVLRYAGMSALLWGLAGLSAAAVAQAPLTLEAAVSLARSNDPWLEGSRYEEEAAFAQSLAAGTLPDPMISLGLSNLPTDSFDFAQEPMTMFKVGVSQMFPRGETPALKRRQLREQGARQPRMRRDRLARVTVVVSHLWLEAYRHREAARLVEKGHGLFEHLGDIAASRYTSGAGRTQQQDLVRAQVELTRLEDRLTLLQQQKERSLAQLSEWLPGFRPSDIVLADTLPALAEPRAFSATADKSEVLAPVLLAHPRIQSLEQKIAATGTGVELAKQQYKPRWGINAGYGYRNDDPSGRDRSDFFSVGVHFDLPLFTANRQDRELQAARALEAATRTEKALALRAMRAEALAALSRLEHLNRRKALYEAHLLKAVHAEAEASLAAYTNDAGDFVEVVRAGIAELDARVDSLSIDMDRLGTIVELNYFLAPPDARMTEGGP